MGPGSRRQQLEAAVLRLFATLKQLDVRNHRDIDAIVALLDPDIDMRIPFLETPHQMRGTAEVRPFLEKMQGMFSHIEYLPENIHVDVEWETVIVETAGRRVMAGSGLVVDIRYVFIFGFRNGRVARWREYVYAPNSAEISRRLGLKTA